MVTLTAEGMNRLTTDKSERLEKLNKLLSEPFDQTNPKHMDALKHYVDDFEFSTNQMYLFQGIGKGLYPAACTWFTGFFLPVPDFVTYFSTAFFYLGVIGHTLQNFRVNDFHAQLEEMKSIYTWSLKAGKVTYENTIENTSKLLNPDIQRMIKLLAPLCTTDFMLAWPKVIEEPRASEGILPAFHRIYSIFAPAPKPTAAEHRVHELKVEVETRALDKNALKAAQDAISYFAPLLMAKVQTPLTTVKELSETAITHFAHSKRA